MVKHRKKKSKSGVLLGVGLGLATAVALGVAVGKANAEEVIVDNRNCPECQPCDIGINDPYLLVTDLQLEATGGGKYNIRVTVQNRGNSNANLQLFLDDVLQVGNVTVRPSESYRWSRDSVVLTAGNHLLTAGHKTNSNGLVGANVYTFNTLSGIDFRDFLPRDNFGNFRP